MKKDEDGRLVPFYKASDLLEKIPELQEMADISVEEVVNVDSSNVDHMVWKKLALVIAEKHEQYDGFIITHGTDTMAYTASALSYALQYLAKPVVFTGAQVPLHELPSDGYVNLMNAILVANIGFAGVFIVFGSKIMQANRATKVSESALDAFDSPMVPLAGKITLKPSISLGSRMGYGKLVCVPEFDPNVLVINITPGLSSKYLDAALKMTGLKGIVLEGFGAGNIPVALTPFLHTAKEKEIPVIVLSQCSNGATKMRLYDVGSHALEAGAIAGMDMTVEAAVTKLIWGLAQGKNRDEIQTLFEANIAGEVTLHE